MRLLRLADVELQAGDRVFRYSRGRALLAASAAVVAGAASIVAGWSGGPPAVCYGVGVTLLGSVLILQRLVRARFRPSNWLVRLRDDGMLIQFRSYLNYHLPAEDLSVVFLPFADVQSARLVHETRTVYTQRGRSQRSRRLVELEVGGETTALAAALAAERARPAPAEKRWYGSSTTLYQHYPVQMTSPTTVRVEWGVVPAAAGLLATLRSHTAVASPVDESEDYTRLASLGDEAQEARLRQLVATGRTIEAIATARRLYGYGLTEAKAFVDGLVTR